MYDPTHGADAIREGMTYQPRTQAAQEYSQSIGNAANAAIKPAMPIIDAWKQGVDIAGRYSPVIGAALRTVPTAIGIAMGAKPALQAGRQVSKGLESMQGRMIANATAPSTLNTAGFRGQRGAIGTLSTDDDLRKLAKFNQMDDIYKFDNSHEYYEPIDRLVSRNLGDDAFDFMELPTSYGKITITPSAKEQGKWQVTQWAKDGYPLSDSGNQTKEKALRTFFEDSKPELLPSPQRPLTEFEQVHLLAQQRAALPVNQMGLDLPANNTAMDRARAMGYQTAPSKEVYHATDVPFEGSIIDPSKSDFGFHVGTLEQANARIMARGKNGTFYRDGANVMPLMTNKYANLLKVTDEGTFHADSLAPQLVKKGLMSKEKAKLIDQEIGGNWDMDKIAAYDQEIRDLLTKEGYDGLKYKNMQEGEGMSYAFSNPSQVRSRFAAFDPFNRDSSDLLAQSAKLAPTTALGAYMYNEKRKKSQGKQ
jgi:hypothetical protein